MPKSFEEFLNERIVHGPIDAVESELKTCWDADKLEALRTQVVHDSTRRLALIADRIGFIRGR